MRAPVEVVIVAVGVSISTWLLGWWAAALVGLVFGIAAHRGTSTEWKGAAAGALGWALLLMLQWTSGDLPATARVIGGVFGVGGAGFIALTLAFAAMLCGSAAGVGRGLARAARTSRPVPR
jgi:hypothetical protein